jgi:hypothetical protein
MRNATVLDRLLAGALLVALLGALGLAVAGRALPDVCRLDAPPDVFSAARAETVLERIALRPHPVLSSEHECVREILLAQLAAIGLAPKEQSGAVDHVPLTNLVARLPGYASTGTVLCLAHYDSVPTGPGAGDDGVGVATWLEAFRALCARGILMRNDLVLVLTDGEERGLLGAQLFAFAHPAAKDVKLVVNLEAIGNGGPAVLFELGPENGARVAEFARTVARPCGTSLSDAVYSRMPNDTDLTVFLKEGVRGFNFALTSGSPAYHAPHDTPAHLDPRALQHMGDCALALVERLGELDLAHGLDGPDVTFFDLLGRGFVAFPRWLDAVPVALGLALVFGVLRAAWRSGTLSLGVLGRHFLGCAARATGLALLLWLVGLLVRPFTPSLDWVAGNTTSGALLFAGLVCWLAAGEIVRTGESAASTARRTLVALGAWCVLSVVALAFLPGATFAFGVPLVFAGLGFRAGSGERPWLAAGVLALGFAAALALMLPIVQLLVQLFLRRPFLDVVLFGTVLGSAATLFAPHFRALGHGAPRARSVLRALGFLALAASVVVARVLVWRQGALVP